MEEIKLASRKELLDSIQPDMELNKNFFLRIFGYSMTTPDFAEEALSKLEIAGHIQARNYYTAITTEWQKEHDKMMKDVAHWYGQRVHSGLANE